MFPIDLIFKQIQYNTLKKRKKDNKTELSILTTSFYQHRL